MSYLPELRSALVHAAHERRAAAKAHPSRGGAAGDAWRRSRRLRVVLANVALGLVITTTGLTAAGVFKRGTPVGPPVPPSPSAGTGVAISSSVRLLGLRVPDPGGGPPWGLRVLRTTRGLTCVQLGRVEFGTVGLLGQDGTFDNDRRFHPLSPNAGGNCGVSDAHGNGFMSVSLQSAPASANVGYEAAIGFCVSTLERFPPGFARRLKLQHRHFPGVSHAGRHACPSGDLRNIYYGLLGPDAVSISYPGPSGKPLTTPTSGPDGAYLLIRPPTTVTCRGPICGNGDSSSPELPAGVITAVRYRDGHVCHLPAPEPAGTPAASCPPFGYVAPLAHRLTTTQLATPISVRKIPAQAYCSRAEAIVPCNGRTPAGFKRLVGGPRSLLVEISFRSRIAIPDSRSYYRFVMSMSRSHGCTEGGSGGPTNSDIRAGQRVVIHTFVSYDCPGPVHGSVSYVPTQGPASSMAVQGLPGQNAAILVGRFSFVMP
jgi:hypothetical protein